MKEWFVRFVDNHGDRIFFALFILALAGVLWLAGEKEQSIGLVMVIAGAFAPKMRGPEKKDQ